MNKILLVTTVCSKDINLSHKRLAWLVALGHANISSDLLLINDGSILDADFIALAKDHENVFHKVMARKILDRPAKQEWPYNVNHAWRTTAMIVSGQYGELVDTSSYIGWFYFEPDVTPLNKDWAAIIEQQYLFNKKPFLGYIHDTPAKNEKSGILTPIRHMNGAGVYPISNVHYNQRIMLIDNLPWDVAGLDFAVMQKIAEIPASAYIMGFSTSNYTYTDGILRATQTLQDGLIRNFSVKLEAQILHHGCKDGSLIDVLNIQHGDLGDPNTVSSSTHETLGIQAPLLKKKTRGRPARRKPGFVTA